MRARLYPFMGTRTTAALISCLTIPSVGCDEAALPKECAALADARDGLGSVGDYVNYVRCVSVVIKNVCHTFEGIPKIEHVLKIMEIIEIYVSGGTHPLLGPGGDSEVEFRNVTEEYPCGWNDERFTLCADPDTDPEGDFWFFGFETRAPIPLEDSGNLFQIGFVFDVDDDPSNNYLPPPEFSHDFFENTDLWYVADYAPATGWSISVSDARNGEVVPLSSEARIVFDGTVVALIVPTDELGDTPPPFRMTTFRHTGDFGVNPPHDWDASVSPPQHEPLHRID